MTDLTERLLELSQQSRRIQVMDVSERQQVIHNLQDKLGVMRWKYRDCSLEFKALSLAWEATRIAWYAVLQNTDGVLEHLEHVDRALTYLLQHLDAGGVAE